MTLLAVLAAIPMPLPGLVASSRSPSCCPPLRRPPISALPMPLFWSRPAWRTRPSQATWGPPSSLPRIPRGRRTLAGEVLPLAWLGWLGVLTVVRWGCLCPLLTPQLAPRRPLRLPPAPRGPLFPMVAMPGVSRLALPPLPPRPLAMRPAPGRLPGAWSGRVLRRSSPFWFSWGALALLGVRPHGRSLLLPQLLRRPRSVSAPMITCRMLSQMTMPGPPRFSPGECREPGLHRRAAAQDCFGGGHPASRH